MIQTLSRRKLLGGLGLLIAAPAIVKASSLMPVKAYVEEAAMPEFTAGPFDLEAAQWAEVGYISATGLKRACLVPIIDNSMTMPVEVSQVRWIRARLTPAFTPQEEWSFPHAGQPVVLR